MTQSNCACGPFKPIIYLILAFASLSAPDSPAADEIKTRPIEPLLTLTGDAAGSLTLPTDVAIGTDGRVYVVDGGNHRLAIFSRNGKHLRSVGRRGSRNGEFLNPVGVGTDHKGRVYVADKDNHRIQVFSAEGQFESAFGVQDNGKPVSPVDVAISNDGKRLYITGNNNHKVMVYSASGARLQSWGGEGVNKGEFRYPATIAVASSGRVYVVDVFNTRVQVFSESGKYLLEFSEWGVLPGQLVRPKGVALDRRGQIFVSDSYMDVIQTFNDAHQFVHVLGARGKPHRFFAAAGIAIDDTNRLYVAEVLKNRVSVYQMEQ